MSSDVIVFHRRLAIQSYSSAEDGKGTMRSLSAVVGISVSVVVRTPVRYCSYVLRSMYVCDFVIKLVFFSKRFVCMHYAGIVQAHFNFKLTALLRVCIRRLCAR